MPKGISADRQQVICVDRKEGPFRDLERAGVFNPGFSGTGMAGYTRNSEKRLAGMGISPDAGLSALFDGS